MPLAVVTVFGRCCGPLSSGRKNNRRRSPRTAKKGVADTIGSNAQHQASPHLTTTEAICTVGIMCMPGGSTDHHSGGGAVSVFSHPSMTPPCEMQKGASTHRGVGTLYRECPYWTTSGAKDTTRLDFSEKRPCRHLITDFQPGPRRTATPQAKETA